MGLWSCWSSYLPTMCVPGRNNYRSFSDPGIIRIPLLYLIIYTPKPHFQFLRPPFYLRALLSCIVFSVARMAHVQLLRVLFQGLGFSVFGFREALKLSPSCSKLHPISPMDPHLPVTNPLKDPKPLPYEPKPFTPINRHHGPGTARESQGHEPAPNGSDARLWTPPRLTELKKQS